MSKQIALAGEQTIYQARETQQQLSSALHDAAELSIDLAAVTEVDSSLLQILLWLKNEGTRLNKSVHLLNPSAALLHVVTLLGLEAQLTFGGEQ